jgi:hypothetical protein
VYERLTRPSSRAAIILFAVALGTMAVWLATDADALDAWIPNIVTGLLVLAATVTIFEWILRSDERRRLEPRLERLRAGLRGNLETFCEIVAVDYKVRGGVSPVPKDMLVFLDWWLADQGRPETDPRSPYVFPVLNLGAELGAALQKYRAEDRDIMEPALVRAIDDFEEKGVVPARAIMLFVASEDDRQATYSVRRAEEALVRAARHLGDALLAWDKDGGPLEFAEWVLTTPSGDTRIRAA